MGQAACPRFSLAQWENRDAESGRIEPYQIRLFRHLCSWPRPVLGSLPRSTRHHDRVLLFHLPNFYLFWKQLTDGNPIVPLSTQQLAFVDRQRGWECSHPTSCDLVKCTCRCGSGGHAVVEIKLLFCLICVFKFRSSLPNSPALYASRGVLRS